MYSCTNIKFVVTFSLSIDHFYNITYAAIIKYFDVNNIKAFDRIFFFIKYQRRGLHFSLLYYLIKVINI